MTISTKVIIPPLSQSGRREQAREALLHVSNWDKEFIHDVQSLRGNRERLHAALGQRASLIYRNVYHTIRNKALRRWSDRMALIWVARRQAP